jgi:hypothetical protein
MDFGLGLKRKFSFSYFRENFAERKIDAKISPKTNIDAKFLRKIPIICGKTFLFNIFTISLRLLKTNFHETFMKRNFAKI